MQKKNKKEKLGWQTVHIQLRKELILELDERAEEENRSRVNMVATILERALAAKEGVQA